MHARMLHAHIHHCKLATRIHVSESLVPPTSGRLSGDWLEGMSAAEVSNLLGGHEACVHEMHRMLCPLGAQDVVSLIGAQDVVSLIGAQDVVSLRCTGLRKAALLVNGVTKLSAGPVLTSASGSAAVQRRHVIWSVLRDLWCLFRVQTASNSCWHRGCH